MREASILSTPAHQNGPSVETFPVAEKTSGTLVTLPEQNVNEGNKEGFSILPGWLTSAWNVLFNNNAIDLTSKEAREHILNGDPIKKSGGHKPGTGIPGKTEFPAGWSDDKIMHEISDIATDPKSIRTPSFDGRTMVEGTRDGVNIRVILDKNSDIITGFPTNLPRNP